MSKRGIIAVVLGLVMGFSAQSSIAADAGVPKLVVCKNRKIARTIRVVKNKDGACETIYTKAGVDRSVGVSRSDSSCFRVIDNIRENLEEAAWKCKDVAQFMMEYPDSEVQ